MLGLTFLLDRVMYGSWVLVPLNFLKFNFLSSGGDYYGTHPWHWYFTQGFTVMIFTFLPFMVVGIIQSKRWKLSGLILWVIGLYSILGHKEFRYVFHYSFFLLCSEPKFLIFVTRNLRCCKNEGKKKHSIEHVILNKRCKCRGYICIHIFLM